MEISDFATSRAASWKPRRSRPNRQRAASGRLKSERFSVSALGHAICPVRCASCARRLRRIDSHRTLCEVALTTASGNKGTESGVQRGRF